MKTVIPLEFSLSLRFDCHENCITTRIELAFLVDGQQKDIAITDAYWDFVIFVCFFV